MTFFQTGSLIAGRPSLGSWVTYGLGSMNENLPGFVVLVKKNPTDQPFYGRLWVTGFLDSRYQGLRFSLGKDAVFFISNLDDVCASGRRARRRETRHVRCQMARASPAYPDMSGMRYSC